MYSSELENLIEMALADGTITDKERSVLHKRAAQEGVDSDELDMVIEGRLSKMKANVPPPSPTSGKLGNAKKCPVCGAFYQPGMGSCPECGHVFQNVEANRSAQKFSDGINALMEKHRKDLSINFFAKKRNDDELRSYIMNFPIPASKDDLIEFILTLGEKASMSNSFAGDERAIGDAYLAKYKEAVNKAHLLFPNDAQMNGLWAEAQKKIKKSGHGKRKALFIIMGLWVVLILFFVLLFAIAR